MGEWMFNPRLARRRAARNTIDGRGFGAALPECDSRGNRLSSPLMTDIRATLRARLDAAVGSAQVLTSESDVLPFVTDWRGRFRGRALAVVRPGATEEVAAVVRACSELGVPIVTQGGNTGQCGGATPDDRGNEIVLSLTRMNRVRA